MRRTGAGALFLALACSAPALADGWWILPPLGTPRYNAGAISVGRRLYTFGGYTSLGPSPDSYSYCDDDGSWTSQTPLPMARYNFMLGQAEGSVYLAGGYSSPSTVTSTLYRFDPQIGVGGSWASLAPHPIPTASGGGAVIYGKFYISTYNDGSGTFRNYLSEYDILGNSWLQKANSLYYHGKPASGNLDGHLILAGGANASGVATNLVEGYDPRTNVWSPLASMPTPLKNAGFAVRNSELWAWGGLDNNGAEQTGVYCYNFRKNQWDVETPLPSARYNSYGAASGRGLYIMGGLHGSTILNAFNGWGLPCYANCDGSTTSPQLNVNDFVCYINKYAAGCK